MRQRQVMVTRRRLCVGDLTPAGRRRSVFVFARRSRGLLTACRGLRKARGSERRRWFRVADLLLGELWATG